MLMTVGEENWKKVPDDVWMLHIWGLNFDSQNLLIATCIGFFLITLVRIVGIVSGDKAPVTVCGKV